MAVVVASLKAIIDLEDNMTKGLKKADKGLSAFSGKLKSTGTQLQGMGAKMSLLTAPLAAGLFVAVDKATQFENAMANVGAILGTTAEETSALSDEILLLGSTAVAGPQAVAESYFDIVSGISDATSHMAIMEAAIATSEAGQANLTATTGALVGIMNAYGLSADQAGLASDIMTQTVGKGVLTMDELAAALPNVTSLSASLGIEFGEVSAALALMTQSGTAASVASNQLKAAMSSLINPNETMKDALEELGFATGQAAIDALGLQGWY